MSKKIFLLWLVDANFMLGSDYGASWERTIVKNYFNRKEFAQR
jgi:hypothetical protein